MLRWLHRAAIGLLFASLAAGAYVLYVTSREKDFPEWGMLPFLGLGVALLLGLAAEGLKRGAVWFAEGLAWDEARFGALAEAQRAARRRVVTSRASWIVLGVLVAAAVGAPLLAYLLPRAKVAVGGFVFVVLSAAGWALRFVLRNRHLSGSAPKPGSRPLWRPPRG